MSALRLPVLSVAVQVMSCGVPEADLLAILVMRELPGSESALPDSPLLPHVQEALLLIPLRACPSVAVFHASGLMGVVYFSSYWPASSVPKLNVAVWPLIVGVTEAPLKVNVAPSKVRLEPMVSVRTTLVALVATLSVMTQLTVMVSALTWPHLLPVVLPSLIGIVIELALPGKTISMESPSPAFWFLTVKSASSENEISEGCWRSHSSPYVR